MYQVFFDGYPLHDLRDDRLLLRDPDVHLAVNEAGTMAFTIDADHPYADRITRLKGVLTLQAGGLPIFRGRVRKDTRDFNLSRRIEVEGLLACLNDSVIPPFNFPGDFEEDAAYQDAAAGGNVVQFFLAWLLAEHNSQVGPDQQIQLGTVSVADPNNYISRASSDYLSTMEAVKKKLLDLMGGHLLIDYTPATPILHYYAALPLTNVQEVEFGENLLDLVTELDAADTYTAILPVGNEGLTIEALPDGEIEPGIWKEGRILYSAETEASFGGVRITKKVTWDDVTLADNLQKKAAAMLTTEGILTTQTITVRAVDLGYDYKLDCDTRASAVASLAVVGEAVVGVGLTYSGVPLFSVGRYVQLNSTPHGLAARYPLMELEPDILDPGNTEIVLGATISAASDIAHKNQAQLQEQQAQLQIELNQQKGEMTALATTTKEQITAAIQTCEQIIFSALESYATTSSLEDFRQTVEAQFSIMSDEIALRFTETTEHIVNVDGDLQQTVETLAKFFEFGMDGLIIKAGENAMTLTLDNDLIVFKKNGQTFGWWDGVDFHTGNIVIDVTERAQLGNFAFVPRSNGSLSFLKVGG